MREAMQPLSTKEYAAEALSKLEGAFSFLKAHESSNGNVGVMGFCFGGTYSFALATQEAGLKAAVVFYGQPPQILESVKNISCPVLGLYGEQDTRLIDSLPQVTEEMKKYDKDFTAKVYKNTGHAFFNDTNARAYNKEAAEDAWLVVNTFLKTHLK
jgi:carboxymethylenebutenolidase